MGHVQVANCIGGIWSDKFRFAVDDKQKKLGMKKQ